MSDVCVYIHVYFYLYGQKAHMHTYAKACYDKFHYSYRLQAAGGTFRSCLQVVSRMGIEEQITVHEATVPQE